MNWKKTGLKKTLLFERTFEVIKIGFYSCCVSHFSLEIFGFVWYVNNSTSTSHCIMTSWEIKYIFQSIPLNRWKFCWVSASGYIQIFQWLSSTTSWFSKKSLHSATTDLYKRRMRWSYLHIKQIQISQDRREIRDSCKDQSL